MRDLLARSADAEKYHYLSLKESDVTPTSSISHWAMQCGVVQGGCHPTDCKSVPAGPSTVLNTPQLSLVFEAPTCFSDVLLHSQALTPGRHLADPMLGRKAARVFEVLLSNLAHHQASFMYSYITHELYLSQAIPNRSSNLMKICQSFLKIAVTDDHIYADYHKYAFAEGTE